MMWLGAYYAVLAGHDCFIFHSSMLDAIDLGQQFLGFPRWGVS